MKKAKRLTLNRETLRQMATPADLREAAGGLTTPITHCNVSVCIDTCVKICNASMPPVCSAKIICGQ